MAVRWFTREHLLPAGAMAFMLVAFLALSFRFDDRWWAAHHGHSVNAPLQVTRSAARPWSEKPQPLPGPLHWKVSPSKVWNGVEETMPAPAPIAHPAVAAKNPKRPFRTITVYETRQIMEELAAAEAMSREEARSVDPAYGRRFGSVIQKSHVSYRQAIADAHGLSEEQMSTIYRQMTEGNGLRRGDGSRLQQKLPAPPLSF